MLKMIFILSLLVILVLTSSTPALPKLERLDPDYSGQPLSSLLKGSPANKYGPPDYRMYKMFGFKIGSPQYFRNNTMVSSGEAKVFKGIGEIKDTDPAQSSLARFIPINLNFRPNNQKSNSLLRSSLADNPQALEYLHEYDNSQETVERLSVVSSVLAVGIGAGVLMIALGNPAGGAVTAYSAGLTAASTVTWMFFSNNSVNYLDKAIDTYNKQ